MIQACLHGLAPAKGDVINPVERPNNRRSKMVRIKAKISVQAEVSVAIGPMTLLACYR
jgi:hypothetical protein